MAKNAAGGLKLLLLGSFCVEVANEEIPMECWKSKKALVLFKYLVTRCGERVPSDMLVDLFWPESDWESGSHNLHTTIYFLRKTLKDAAPPTKDVSSQIRFANGMYWFEVEDDDFIDTIEFSALCSKNELLERSDPERALAAGEGALRLYRGDFLTEEPYADWTVSARTYYRDHYVEVALRTSRLLVQHEKDYKRAIRILRAALNMEPYREELHQALITYLIESNRYPEATAQYRACAKLLQNEFGLDPSPETRALLNLMRDAPDMKDLMDGLGVNASQGPLVCDRKSFESILQLEKRRLEREESPVTVVTISIKEHGDVNGKAQRVLESLGKTLRKGDVACQWSKNSVAVLLPSTNEFAASVVVKRIRRTLEGASLRNCLLKHYVVSDASESLKTELVNSL